MKNIQTSQPSALAVLLKSISTAFASLFQSGSNREFRRLKDFITS